MGLQSINIFKSLDVKNSICSIYTCLDTARHYPAHVTEILPGWWDPKIKRVASRTSSFDTQHFIILFLQFLSHQKDYMGSSAHGSFLSWSCLSPEGNLRWPENKTHAVKSLDHPPLSPTPSWTLTYFSSALRTGGRPPQLCLYTVSRIWQPWICGKHRLFNLNSISVVHVAKTHILYSIQRAKLSREGG